ncbi:hypothetical protein NM208_g9492 [Fusarium decemcellulare]|uniref:Uncharacterized protein n=1 Tax=Fusarium decemcellulare TaxID=57161 RepID=A0ACC1S1C9_9HYPO|nr:hypothetical protein NM208_g9492 [Fusarium decemcellulare]
MAPIHGQAEREEIQNELHIEVLPGTEIMADIGHHHFIKSEHHRVLVPQPTQNPHDPLNWKTSWKLSAILAVSTMTFTQGFAPLALAPMFPYLMEDYHRSLADIIQFTAVTILILGFSNFIWFLLPNPYISPGSLFIIGFQSPPPSVDVQSTLHLNYYVWHPILFEPKLDRIEFLWELAFFMALEPDPPRPFSPRSLPIYFFSMIAVAPTVSGPMADHIGWQNFWWLNVALTGLSILMGLFGFPETTWSRAESSSEEAPVSDTSTKATSQHVEPSSIQEDQEKGHSGQVQPMQQDAPDVDPFLGYLSQVFAASPYNMSSQSIGFLNFAILAGALIGLITAGPFSDWVSTRATKRNGGIREPEMRLPAMIPYMILMVFGNVITAIGYEKKWPWPIIAVLGYASTGLQVTALPSIASTYAVDSYRPVSGPLFVAITVNKNLWGYGMGRFLTPWTMKAGFLPAFMVNMALTEVD